MKTIGAKIRAASDLSGQRFEERFAVAFEFGGAYAGNAAEVFEGLGAQFDERHERGVVEDDIGRDVLGFGEGEAQGAEGLEKGFVFVAVEGNFFCAA